MRSLSSVGLALSLVFGCLLLALAIELYILLWWKKRITNRDSEDVYNSPASDLIWCLFPWKKTTSSFNPQDTHVHEPQSQLHLHSNQALWLKPFEEYGPETELMRLQTITGPPRFLFTIKEETKEDLESEDGLRSRSLSDLETPFLTPLSSPLYFTPPLSPMDSLYNHHGFNPLFESSIEAEFNRIRTSPPSRFKFLRDDEDKLCSSKMMEETEEGMDQTDGVKGSFITIVIDKNIEKRD